MGIFSSRFVLNRRHLTYDLFAVSVANVLCRTVFPVRPLIVVRRFRFGSTAVAGGCGLIMQFIATVHGLFQAGHNYGMFIVIRCNLTTILFSAKHRPAMFSLLLSSPVSSLCLLPVLSCVN